MARQSHNSGWEGPRWAEGEDGELHALAVKQSPPPGDKLEQEIKRLDRYETICAIIAGIGIALLIFGDTMFKGIGVIPFFLGGVPLIVISKTLKEKKAEKHQRDLILQALDEHDRRYR